MLVKSIMYVLLTVDEDMVWYIVPGVETVHLKLILLKII